MKTRIHFYAFTLPEQKEEWETLKAFLEAEIGIENRFKATGKHNLPFKDGEEIELDEKYLFSNQWNTAGERGSRVFDWWQEVNFNHYGGEITSYKSGHWLEQTEEMKCIRQDTVICGFCGHQGQATEEGKFCSSCLDSQFLDEDELYLLRMLPVALPYIPFKKARRAPLTEEEREELLPKYIQARTVVEKARREAQKRKIEKKYEEAEVSAYNEFTGMMWLWERNIPLDNVLYYTSTKRFVIGWRSELSPSVADEMLAKVEGFPFKIEVKRSK